MVWWGYCMEFLVMLNRFPSLFEIFLCCLIIGLIWGATNPLIKRTTTGIKSVPANCGIKRFYYELKYLISNWRYVLLFFINQCGSVFYFLLLQTTEISLIVPVTNALTLIFTGVFGILLGEEKPNLGLFSGSCLVLAGIALCILDDIEDITEVPI